MRNLKRALSLALAAIMLIGMMVVSACAVSYNDLTDKDQIVNKDAVSMLVSLGIIEGKPDGSYAPTENVDRAQMAKMLSVIMNKGVDNSCLLYTSCPCPPPPRPTFSGMFPSMAGPFGESCAPPPERRCSSTLSPSSAPCR